MTLDIEHLRTWIGRTELAADSAATTPIRALAAALDRDDAPARTGDGVPPCWHWLYFLPTARQSEIGSDGHPQRGGFLPPVRLPRRMWAASRMEFTAPLRLGQVLERVSRIQDVRLKEGRSGPLVFVNVRHEIRGDGELCIIEEQDIVYRDMPGANEQPAAAAVAALDVPQWVRRITPDPVLLFRYSALTFNGHRIHYDRSYAADVEHYAGLVVQGPLIATLLLELLHGYLPQACLKTFEFRAVKPLLDIAAFEVCGRQLDAETVKLWARNDAGELAMDAVVTLY